MSHLGDPFGLDRKNLFVRPTVEYVDRTIDGQTVDYWYAFAMSQKDISRDQQNKNRQQNTFAKDLQAKFDELLLIAKELDSENKRIKKLNFQLDSKLTHKIKVNVEVASIVTGLRHVIRALVAALKKSSPDHVLLDKNSRNKVFSEVQKETFIRFAKREELDPWTPYVLPASLHSSE